MTEAIPDEPLGDHVLELQIAEVVAETDEARSLVFAVPDEQGDPDIPPGRLRYSPGQFLTLRIPSERTGSVARCYSLCSSPFTDDALTVTVKRTADGSIPAARASFVRNEVQASNSAEPELPAP